MSAVSVIIVNWNGKKFLSDCLEGLRRQTFNDFLTVLIDNASEDGSLEFVRANYPEVKTLSLTQNFGFAIANNIAIKALNSKYVALLNNDAVPHADWLRNLLQSLDSHPEAGFVASKMLFYDRPDIIDRAGDVYTTAGTGLLRGRSKNKADYNGKEWIFGACAGAALYRKKMLDDIGLFDEDFFLVYEDVDLSFRAQLRGYKCMYVPEAIVYHRASGSIGDDSSTSVYYSHRNLEWVYLKNMPGYLIVKTIIPHIIYDLASLSFFTISGKLPEFVKAKYHALKGLNQVLKKRRQIQKKRHVDDAYIWKIMEREQLLPRLTRRLKP